MNIEKQKKKLSQLSDRDLDILLEMVLEEKSNRPTVMSNTTHTPNEQCKSLQDFFAQAWIH